MQQLSIDLEQIIRMNNRVLYLTTTYSLTTLRDDEEMKHIQQVVNSVTGGLYKLTDEHSCRAAEYHDLLIQTFKCINNNDEEGLKTARKELSRRTGV